MTLAIGTFHTSTNTISHVQMLCEYLQTFIYEGIMKITPADFEGLHISLWQQWTFPSVYPRPEMDLKPLILILCVFIPATHRFSYMKLGFKRATTLIHLVFLISNSVFFLSVRLFSSRHLFLACNSLESSKTVYSLVQFWLSRFLDGLGALFLKVTPCKLSPVCHIIPSHK